MAEDVWILGISMTKFGKHRDKDVIDLASAAAFGALTDAGIGLREVGMLAAGCLTGGSSTFGQQLLKQIGQTGIPVFNVANACATGATALRVAIMAVKAGEADFGLAVGVEYGASQDGEVSFELFARIAEKNHAHSTLNPLAAYSKRFTLDEIMNDVMIAYPNTRPMCSANCDGAAAAIVVSDSKLKTLSLSQRLRAVKISASVLTSDPWQEACQVLPDVNTLTRQAADQAYEQAGVGPDEVDLVELHDCFATAELVHYDNLRLCEPGGAVDLFNSGATWRDGLVQPAPLRARSPPRPRITLVP